MLDIHGNEYEQIILDIGGNKVDKLAQASKPTQMGFTEYQELASRTANEIKDTIADGPTLEIVNYCFGLAGESGEFIDYLKKVLFHNHEIDYEIAKKELGDILWYVSQISRKLGFNLSDVAELNIEKLKKRYPEGFSTERSVNRAD